MIYKYYINLYERGDFNADVRAPDGTTVFEITDTDHLDQLIEDGFMHNFADVEGLTDYLAGMGVIGEGDYDRIVSAY